MKLAYALLLSIALSGLAHASLPIEASMEEIVAKTDHVFVGHVIGVDMVDGNGKQISDLSARTGPGLKSKIRLIIKIEKTLRTNAKASPEVVKVPLDSMMHYEFRAIKAAYPEKSSSRLILLSGAKYQPPIPGLFMQSIQSQKHVLKLYDAKSKEH
jgi:hypothetical protein